MISRREFLQAASAAASLAGGAGLPLAGSPRKAGSRRTIC